MPVLFRFTRWWPVARTNVENLGRDLNKLLSKMSSEQLDVAEKAIRATYIETANEIVMKTPVDTGRARANWFLTKNTPSQKTIKGSNYNGRISEIRRKLGGEILGKVFYLVNNLPYIGALEYGGYPKNPEKGSKRRKGQGYQIRSINGFSKQAPNGMVRLSTAKFSKRFKRYLKVYGQ